jgi:hypothetical protein
VEAGEEWNLGWLVGPNNSSSSRKCKCLLACPSHALCHWCYLAIEKNLHDWDHPCWR